MALGLGKGRWRDCSQVLVCFWACPGTAIAVGSQEVSRQVQRECVVPRCVPASPALWEQMKRTFEESVVGQ